MSPRTHSGVVNLLSQRPQDNLTRSAGAGLFLRPLKNGGFAKGLEVAGNRRVKKREICKTL